MDGQVVITRHMAQLMPEYEFASDQRPKEHTPVGFDLVRPFPDARVYLIDIDTQANGGWIYVYWVSTSLMHPEGRVEVKQHIEMEG